MTRVLVTGRSGFLGLNVLEALNRRKLTVRAWDRAESGSVLDRHVADADVVCHLESVYRPGREEEFEDVNVGVTRRIVDVLTRTGRAPTLLYASSVQAEGSSAYGRSRRRAEDLLREYSTATGASVGIFRLANEFGKWCRPDDNSVVATFCDRLARGLEIVVAEPDRVLSLVYIDDIVAAFVAAIENRPPGLIVEPVGPLYSMTVGELASRLRGFQESRKNLLMPDCADRLNRCLYATYISFLRGADFSYPLQKREDDRGALAEYFKSPHFGQVFVSRTRPGVTRGNHYHDTKVEKFCVLEGEAVVRFRHLVTHVIVEHRIRGDEFRIADIPPGYVHSIENVGSSDLIVLFWASEVFDPATPDTYPREVLRA